MLKEIPEFFFHLFTSPHRLSIGISFNNFSSNTWFRWNRVYTLRLMVTNFAVRSYVALEKQAEVGDTMKEIKRKFGIAILAMALMVIGLVTEASAKLLGDGVTILGYNGGWVLLIVGIVFGVLFGATKILAEKAKMVAMAIALIMVLAGIACLVVDVEEASVTTTTSPVSDWGITATDITAASWITGTGTWDDEDDPGVITLQLNHDTTDNTYDELVFVANFTIDPAAGDNADTTNLVTLHYKTDYDMKYSGEYVLEKSGNNFLANWSVGGVTKYYSGSVDMQLTDTVDIQAAYTFDSGNETVGEHLDAIGDSTSWTITFWDDYGWQDTFTVTAIVITHD